MGFQPRLTAPVKSNPSDNFYYFSHNNIYWDNKVEMPNCTCYAYSRWREILGTKPDLPYHNAGQWYRLNKESGTYPYGQVPKLGAIICFGKVEGAGHVAVVEQINYAADGSIKSIVTSDSGWKRPKESAPLWWLANRFPPEYVQSAGYYFQGFIYCPACENLTSALSGFLSNAESKVNTCVEDWVAAELGSDHEQTPGNISLVLACAKSCGALNTIIHSRSSIKDIVDAGITWGTGAWLPADGTTPQPGDLVAFRDCNNAFDAMKDLWELYTDGYYGDRFGIVTDIIELKLHTSIQVILGEVSSGKTHVNQKIYSLHSKTIYGYYRPNWSKLGASVSNVLGYPSAFSALYDMENSEQDAVVREVRYADRSGEPSITPTDIRLSVINYTGVLGAMFSFVGQVNGQFLNAGISSANIENLDAVPQQIVNCLLAKGLSIAACIGIIANVEAESSFNLANEGPDIDGKIGGGMCGWHDGNFRLMVQCVGQDWRTNLSGQCDFLYDYMTKGEPYQGETWFASTLKSWYGYEGDMVTALNSLPNTEAGARDAAALFMLVFENPTNRDTTKRRDIASKHWNKLVMQQEPTALKSGNASATQQEPQAVKL